MSEKLWIDTDAGVDDAQGLLLAVSHPGSSIVGISTVHGNTVRARACVEWEWRWLEQWLLTGHVTYHSQSAYACEGTCSLKGWR